MIKKNESSLPVEQASTDHFTGDAWIKRYVRNADVRVNVVSVTFEPAARTDWHTHPKGQILIVTAGKGYVQKAGEPIQLLLPGDIVTISPDELHWHGATADNLMVHLAIQPILEDGGDTTWVDRPVTDEAYSAGLIGVK